MPIYLSLALSVCVLVCLSVCQLSFVCLSVCLSACLSVYWSVWTRSVSQSVCRSVSQAVGQSVSLSVGGSVGLSMCLFACSRACTAKTWFRQGVAPATHLRNQQRLREALGCVRWLRGVAALAVGCVRGCSEGSDFLCVSGHRQGVVVSPNVGLAIENVTENFTKVKK